MATMPTRKYVKAKPKEAEALKKISSMINRALDLNTILVSTLDEIMVLLKMDAGIFRMKSASEASPKTVSCGFSKETSAVFEQASTDFSVQHSSATMISGEISSEDRVGCCHVLHIWHRALQR